MSLHLPVDVVDAKCFFGVGSGGIAPNVCEILKLILNKGR